MGRGGGELFVLPVLPAKSPLIWILTGSNDNLETRPSQQKAENLQHSQSHSSLTDFPWKEATSLTAAPWPATTFSSSYLYVCFRGCKILSGRTVTPTIQRAGIRFGPNSAWTIILLQNWEISRKNWNVVPCSCQIELHSGVGQSCCI